MAQLFREQPAITASEGPLAARTTAIRRFSTRILEPARALDLWVSTLDRALVPSSRDSAERNSFEGQTATLPVKDVAFNQVKASPQDVYRTRSHVARSAYAPCFLLTDTTNSWHMRQGSSYIGARAGDLVLIDSAEPYELHFTGTVNTFVAELPKAWLGHWLAVPDGKTPRTVARDQGWGQALSALCCQFGNDLDLAEQHPASLLSDHLGATIAACLEPSTSIQPPASARALLARANRLMREQLDNSGLTAAQVALDLGISVRTLHREFARQGSTFAGTLRGMRLALAASLLTQPRLAQLSVAMLGQRCGYSEPSHFAREFRRAHGLSPSGWRAKRLL